MASGSFVLLGSVVGLLYLRFRSEVFVVAAALVWIVFSIFGRVFSQTGSGIFRFVILLLLLGFVALLLRIFRAKIITWFLIASVDVSGCHYGAVGDGALRINGAGTRRL